MKVTSIEIHPENSSEVVVLSFRDPKRSNKYNVKSITGLDADTIVNFSLQKRDVTIVLSLNPDFAVESYSDLRDNLYRIIVSSRTGKVQLQFKNGINVTAGLSGVLSKFESPLFEKTGEITIVISCDDSMLKALVPTYINVSGLDPNHTVISDNESTAPHGFQFDLRVLVNLPSLIITDPTDTSWNFKVTPAGGFLTGDIFTFSSEANNKQLYLIRTGIDIYLADVVSSDSIWPILYPGDNTFSLTNSTGIAWNAILHYPTYWGV